MVRHVPARLHFRVLRCGVLAAVLIGVLAPALAIERDFPFGRELMLDTRPMKGSKRVPILNVEANGGAVIELWCNTVKARIEVAGNTFSVTAGSRSEQQCAPERLRADDELIHALLAITSWQRAGDVLTLRGTKTLRFRTPTH